MKILIKNIKFNSFESYLIIDGTIFQGNLSYPRIFSFGIDCLNNLINKITSENIEIDFYQGLSSEIILGETYFKFQASQDCIIENFEDWYESLNSSVSWKMIA